MIDQGDILRVVLSLAMPESVVAQLVYHLLATAGTGGDPDDVLTAINAAVVSAFGAIEGDMDAAVFGTEIELFQYDTVEHQFDGIASQAVTGIAGTDVGEMLPHGTCPVVKFFTETGRRQGRKFMPGYTEAQQEDGTLDPSAVTALVNFALAFHDDFVGDGITLALGNFNVDPTSALYETFGNWGGTVEVDTTMGYQRRRKAGVGI